MPGIITRPTILMVDDCAVTIKALNWGTSRFIGFLKRAVYDYGSSRNSIKGFGAQ